MAAKTRDRIIQALSNGPLSFYELALKVYPPDDYPKAWRYSRHGGPPGCYMTLSAMIRRMDLDEWSRGSGSANRMVMLPHRMKVHAHK
jgi:hypothetical protein